MLLPTNRRPTPPGEILVEEYLKPKGLTQVELARRMGVPIQRLNTLINGKRGVTAETAWLLARELGTSPDLWMNLQVGLDLWDARQRLERAGVTLPPLEQVPVERRAPAVSPRTTAARPSRRKAG